MQTQLYPPGKDRVSFAVQTDPKLSKIIKRSIKMQTEHVADLYRYDWSYSKVFKRALQAEAYSRGFDYDESISEDEDEEPAEDAVTGYNQTIKSKNHSENSIA